MVPLRSPEFPCVWQKGTTSRESFAATKYSNFVKKGTTLSFGCMTLHLWTIPGLGRRSWPNLPFWVIGGLWVSWVPEGYPPNRSKSSILVGFPLKETIQPLGRPHDELEPPCEHATRRPQLSPSPRTADRGSHPSMEGIFPALWQWKIMKNPGENPQLHGLVHSFLEDLASIKCGWKIMGKLMNRPQVNRGFLGCPA